MSDPTITITICIDDKPIEHVGFDMHFSLDDLLSIDVWSKGDDGGLDMTELVVKKISTYDDKMVIYTKEWETA